MKKKKRYNSKHIYVVIILLLITSIIAVIKPLTNNNLQGHLNMQYDDHYLDNDGLTTENELQIGTDPLNPDSDNDGFSDGFEVKHGLNPLDKFDPCNPNTIDNNNHLYNCFSEKEKSDM